MRFLLLITEHNKSFYKELLVHEPIKTGKKQIPFYSFESIDKRAEFFWFAKVSLFFAVLFVGVHEPLNVDKTLDFASPLKCPRNDRTLILSNEVHLIYFN